ncbi:tRNA (guanine(10)-N(2))-dimethyltransferase [Candidatus Altiarchaeota archaeon]
MKLKAVVEGKTRLKVPVVDSISKSNVVFYNPVMSFDRDINVAVARLVKPETYADILAGSGARGIRVAKEVGAHVFLNDLNPSGVKLIEKNLKLNEVVGDVSCLDANRFLNEREERFEWVDVDPFGTPSPFVDSALRSVKNGGVLAVTATDTSALCGTYPRACRRKYDSLSLRTDYYNELGLRILIGFVARQATKHDLGISVLLSYSHRHFFRAYLKVFLGNRAVKDTLKNVSHISHCFGCLERRYGKLDDLGVDCNCGQESNSAGPLWRGAFADPKFCSKIVSELNCLDFSSLSRYVKMVSQVGEEQNVAKPYMNIHKFFSKRGASSKRMDEVFNLLESNGFSVSRTHFSGVGLRTDASISDLDTVL